MRSPRTLPGHIEAASPEVEEAAFRRFVEGFTRLAIDLIREGKLDPSQVLVDHATDESGTIGA